MQWHAVNVLHRHKITFFVWVTFLKIKIVFILPLLLANNPCNMHSETKSKSTVELRRKKNQFDPNAWSDDI